MDGIAGVQARINEILSRFTAPPAATMGGTDDFATALAQVQAGAGATDMPGTGDASRAVGVNRAGVHPTQWALDFLERLGMPKTSENVRVLVAWQQAEGTAARFNPLATMQGHAGATKFNSIGVKNYASYEDGLEATVKGIRNGRYDHILAALRRGDSAEAVAQAIKDSPWGSGGLVLQILHTDSTPRS